jgi:hypothetical protein
MFFLNLQWVLHVLYIKKKEQQGIMPVYLTVLPIWCFVLNLLWHNGSQSALRRDQFLGDLWIHICNGNIKLIYFLN